MSKFNLFSKNNDSQEELKNLSDENERLKLQIDLMISKINSLEVKTEELRRIIIELKNQRKRLTETIEKLETLHKEKEDLIEIAAHDIKNPAGTIKNLVVLLESFDLTAQEQNEIHQSLMNISNTIVAIVNNLTVSIKRSKGTFELNVSSNNINSIIENLLSRYQIVAHKKSIKLTSTLAENIPDTLCDETKIDEVIENLINNALKFAPKNSTVEVKTKKEENFIVVEVIDNGVGLTEEEARIAFDKNEKLSNTPTGGESSSGLGLWIVRKFVEKHNGRVWITSKKGTGSTFAFKIPIKQKED